MVIFILFMYLNLLPNAVMFRINCYINISNNFFTHFYAEYEKKIVRSTLGDLVQSQGRAVKRPVANFYSRTCFYTS